MKDTNDRQTKTTALLVRALWMASSVFANYANAEPDAGIEISAEDFTCLNDMTRVRHFFVDNILDDLEGTLEVAHSPAGGIYPPGSVVQLVPTAVMVVMATTEIRAANNAYSIIVAPSSSLTKFLTV